MLSTLRKRTRVALAAAAVLPLLALAACSGAGNATAANAAPTNGTLTVGLLGDIGQPPDPDIYYANNGLAIVLNTYEGLVQYANDTDKVEIAPRLATSWDVSSDNTTYTFHLRKGVTFHDGTPFTSAAVKVAFDRRIAVKGGAAYMVEGVQSVTTPDDLTAVVTLDKANSAFLDYLASPFGPKMESPTALQQHAGSDDAQTWLQTHDAGTGPYEISAADPGTSWTLKQYDGYWGTKSPFTTVKLPIYSDVSALQLAFDRGDVSAVVAALPSSSLSKYEDSEAYASYMLPTLQSALVTLNPSRPFFATKEARLAFLQSIDQESLVKQVLGSRSEPATTLYAKGMIPAGKDEQELSLQARRHAGLREVPAEGHEHDHRLRQRQHERPADGEHPGREAAGTRDRGHRQGLPDVPGLRLDQRPEQGPRRLLRRQQRPRRRLPVHVGPRVLGQVRRHQLLRVRRAERGRKAQPGRRDRRRRPVRRGREGVRPPPAATTTCPTTRTGSWRRSG